VEGRIIDKKIKKIKKQVVREALQLSMDEKMLD